MKRSHKTILVFVLLFLVLLSYHGMMASKIGFFDFSFLYTYVAFVIVVICLGVGIVRKSRFVILTSIATLALIISSAYTTQSIVNYQRDQARDQAMKIVKSIQSYRQKYGKYPANLAELDIDSTYFLGMFPRKYYYKNEDSTFVFIFQGTSGGVFEWSHEAQSLYWYD